MSKWPLAVFFDFDGVIVNSEPLHFQAMSEVLADENIELSEAEYYRELVGIDDRGGFTHVYQKHGRPVDARTIAQLVMRKSQAFLAQQAQRVVVNQVRMLDVPEPPNSLTNLIESGKTRKGQAKAALKRLQQAGVHPLGVILTKIDAYHDLYGYHSYYYQYASAEPAAARKEVAGA